MSILYFVVQTLVATLLGASFLACLWLLLSYLFVYPRPKISINESASLPEYRIMISNSSNRNIYNLEFSFKFDGNYPVKYYLEELNFKTDIILRSFEDYYVEEHIDGERVNHTRPITLINGFRGAVSELPPGTSIAIKTVIDKTYDGSRGHVFPPCLMPELRNHCYYIEYRFKPLGFFEPFYAKKGGSFNFEGKKTKLDNYKTYVQKILLFDGKEIEVNLEISEKSKKRYP